MFTYHLIVFSSSIDQRFEDARIHEQEADFARQEKILKLISSELTRNTTRVVEVAVKNEVQTSVLPSLEAITRKEVRDALNDQVGRGLVDVISQVCFLTSFHVQSLSLMKGCLLRGFQLKWRSSSLDLILVDTTPISSRLNLHL